LKQKTPYLCFRSIIEEQALWGECVVWAPGGGKHRGRGWVRNILDHGVDWPEKAVRRSNIKTVGEM